MRDGKEGDGGEKCKYGETIKVIVQARVDGEKGRQLERQTQTGEHRESRLTGTDRGMETSGVEETEPQLTNCWTLHVDSSESYHHSEESLIIL